MRETISGATRLSRTGSSRGTGAKYYDNNLMQEVDVNASYSETHTKIERPQPVGMTAVPLKQDEEQQQGQQQQSASSDTSGGFNDNQPKGPAAEPFIHYMGGNHSHPIALVTDDRRVRPYNMQEGEAAFYHPTGSEQMFFMNDKGAYLVSLDGKSVKNKSGNETRMASLRHVTKEMQSHKIEKQQSQGQQQGQQQSQQEQEYKHEGKTVNTEVRVIKDRIEFRAGEKVVGYYEVSSDTWYFTGKLIHNDATNEIRDTSANVIQRTATNNISDSAKRIDHN